MNNADNQDHQKPARQEEDKKRKRLLILLLLLLLLAISCICITIWAIFFRETSTVLSPDYAPQDTEINQVPIEGDNDDKMEVENGGGAVSLAYSSYVTIDLSDELAILTFANPNKSTQDILIQIMIQDEILVQSNRLTPGNKVTALNLLKDAKKKLSVGGYDGKFVVFYYDPNTGEKSIVNTEIPIFISVIE